MASVGEKRKANILALNNDDELEIMPLGSGNEVGSESASVLTTFNGFAPFHMDRCASLPYLLAQTTFKGRVFMTHPAKALYKMILIEQIKAGNHSLLYEENEVEASMQKIEGITYHTEMEVSGIKFWCYNAGHVLGAAMFIIEIAGTRVLYTGDFTRIDDRHLMGAETPLVSPDVLIMESIGGVQILEPRLERERRLTTFVHDILKRGGKCLLPASPLGRAQELLLILARADEYWELHPELWEVPIYYISNLAKRCMTVYQTYTNMMNDKMRKQISVSNPFMLKHVTNVRATPRETGRCVVISSPGNMQAGLSRDLFDAWCTDKKNGLILTDYCAENTFARMVQDEPTHVTISSGTVALNMSVVTVPFSAHSDFLQTSEFIETLHTPNVAEIKKLETSLVQKYEKLRVFTPSNCQAIQLQFKAEKTAKVIGRLATDTPTEGRKVSGIAVVKDFSMHIIDPADINSLTQMNASKIVHKLHFPYSSSIETLLPHLSDLFETVRSLLEIIDNGVKVEMMEEERKGLRVCNTVDVLRASGENILVEWSSDPVNDMIADTVICIILQSQLNPRGISVSKITQSMMLDLLTKQFGEGVREQEEEIHIRVESHECKVYTKEDRVEGDEELRMKVEAYIKKIQQIVEPIPSSALSQS
ncbi:putative cleavage and polyadenylation specificity factor [Planoprotostelium fungivorum]|uniref:Putative cleavage and polyadenylation specificity factor n=1 Tax=Planoprotostelium fungivorum TaxID=1890364 RepID=A0A2P6N3H4_9EUKA|nr:putative cleavage and polyadenylation specificity factor [Planoprotostelium fungivorum]